MDNTPAWLETLWNVNPRLAEQAQLDVERWQELEQRESKLNLQNVIIPLSYEFIKWRNENFTKIQTSKYRRNNNHKSIMDNTMLKYAYKDYLKGT